MKKMKVLTREDKLKQLIGRKLESSSLKGNILRLKFDDGSEIIAMEGNAGSMFSPEPCFYVDIQMKVEEKYTEIEEYFNAFVYYVGWSNIDKCFLGLVEELPSIRVHGETEEKTLEELRFIVKDVIQDLVKNGEPIPAPFSYKEEK